MDKYDEKAAKITLAVATIFQMSLGKPSEESAEEVVAAALRESAAEAFEEARERAQIEVNACEHHAKAVRSGRTLHIAAGNVAGVILNFCSARIAALRSTTRGKGA